LLYWLLQEIRADADLELQLAVTGAHLSPEFGSTYQAIEADGFRIDAKVEMLLSGDTPSAVAKSIGLGVIGFADAFVTLRPDIVVVLGDRFEILAAVQTAMVMGIPTGHISGGEITEGAVDDSIRHAITKMAHFHFVANDNYRRRVVQMGEIPEHVINCGDPGLDNFRRLTLLSRSELETSLGMQLRQWVFLVTYHPVTAGATNSEQSTRELLAALDKFPAASVIMTKTNADVGGRVIGRLLEEYAARWPGRVFLTPSLGQLRYLSAMKHCDAVIGNSSSGIVEAPALPKPTINIGRRQHGRLRALSILDCEDNRQSIEQAIRQALSSDFQAVLSQTRSLYGDCDASLKIKDYLKSAPLESATVKRFIDIRMGDVSEAPY
jgi:UDP-N-acetylglucosamine 2-epimerase (non-hydrolysing)/GDP/UDP-N,N'-diacetylbacillosamine 2-epimerase (hydrolysing)